MKFALSNTALPALNHVEVLPRLGDMGFTGLEVAPAQMWADTWRGPDAASVTAYRRAAQAAGLEIIGLNSLLNGQPGLGIFRDAETVQRTEDFLVHLSALCRDLGGRTLILGGGRELNGLPPGRAWIACHAFLERLLPRIEDHGTMLCFAPLGSAEAGFCHTATNCRILATAVDHPAFGLQLNSGALTENGESGHAIFSAIYGHLEHFTINEPGLAPLGDSGRVDHPAMRRHLSASGYRGWVSVEQRATDDPLGDLARSARFLADCYLRKDNLSLDLLRQAQAAPASSINPI
jgi:sugar phosphate isomerase/epimerase